MLADTWVWYGNSPDYESNQCEKHVVCSTSHEKYIISLKCFITLRVNVLPHATDSTP